MKPRTVSAHPFELTSFVLHILAMIFMLCDHLWATIVPGNQWLTCLGRLTFPIYAFLITEGYFHTKNLRRYLLRLLIFAVVSEIPFNLMCGNSLFYPIHQNVLWTLLLGLLLIHWNEHARKKGGLPRRILTAVTSVVVGYAAGFLTFLDYFGVGVITVVVFYFFRERKWWCLLGQIVVLWYLNTEVLGGLGYDLTLFGRDFFLVQQSLALLALIPIWLYRGRQGYHSKPFQYFCYAFYPGHILLLFLLQLL